MRIKIACIQFEKIKNNKNELAFFEILGILFFSVDQLSDNLHFNNSSNKLLISRY